MPDRKKIGRDGEDTAVNYLESLGYLILHRNYHIGRSCEIDIIARTGDTICFVEVKTRTGLTFGSPAESVTRNKQMKIKGIANLYSSRVGNPDLNYRFDIIEVMPVKAFLRHITNAF